MPPGEVRGFDVRTGEQRWLFRSVPGEGEFGNETWEEGSWKTTGGANVWTLMSADEDAGLRLPALQHPLQRLLRRHSGPAMAFSGRAWSAWTHAPASAVWHFQLVHHGLWDYDLPAAPNLIDIRVNGAARQGRRAGEQAGLRLRLRPRDRQADLAHRGAARPAIDRARREVIAARSPSRPSPRLSTGKG